MDTLTRRLEACYTGVIHDVMRGQGYGNFTLPPEIRPIIDGKIMAGPVFTILGRVEKGSDAHQTLLEWTGLLSQAPAGHIWVSQPNDDTVAHMGELSAETLMLKNIRGCFLDGYARDIAFLLEMGFQTWCRGFTPRDIVSHWLPEAVNVPVVIGEVTINPGDYMLADRDGAVVLPAEQAEEIIERAEQAIATENKVRTAILSGVDPQQAYIQFGKF